MLSFPAEDNYCVNIHLFGSSLNSSNPSDIDLLYIYKNDNEPLCYKQAISFKNIILKRILHTFNIPADVILLSIDEEKELSYLNQINHIKLY